MHDIQKLALDVKFKQMKAKKFIKRHGNRAVSAMYKAYTKLKDMKLMGALDPDSLKISQKKGSL